MQKLLILLLIFIFSLSAATPKLYKPIGDPIYKEIKSVQKMSDIGYFKNEKQELLKFIKEAKAHKKLGLEYDKQRVSKILRKKDQRSYLNNLRALDRELSYINTLAKEALPVLIKRRYVQSFYQLKATQLPFLTQDAESAFLVKNYDKQLNKEKQGRLLAQERKKRNKAISYQKMLYSSKNLNGQWKGKSSDKSKLLAKFDASKLTLTYITPEKSNIFTGTYSISKVLRFNILHKELVRERGSHQRDINIKRDYEIIKLTKKELILNYKDERLTFKRN